MKNNLYSFITKNFKPGEPFFYKDLLDFSSKDSIRYHISLLLKEEKLKRYSNGTFYIPKKSLLGLPPILSTESVAVSKYITHRKEIFGYYSGQTFANQIGISLQVPVLKEIVTNNCSSIKRTVQLKQRRFQVMKAKVHIDNDNYKILQLLSLLENYSKYKDYEVPDADAKIKKYAKDNNITRDKLNKYASYFNGQALNFINKLGL